MQRFINRENRQGDRVTQVHCFVKVKHSEISPESSVGLIIHQMNPLEPSINPELIALKPHGETMTEGFYATLKRKWSKAECISRLFSIIATTTKFKPPACWGFRRLSPFCLHSYPDSLAVGTDVGRRPVGHALHVQGSSFTEAAFLERFSPGMEQTIHLEQLASW